MKMCSHAALLISCKKIFEPILIYVKTTNLCQYFAMIPKDISRQSKTYADVTSLGDKPT